MKNKVEYVNLARDAWNEAAPIHQRATHELLDDVRDNKQQFIHDIQLEELRRIGVEGACVAQLNCNNGRELITIKRLGAGHCTGFDIAEGFIEQSRQLASAAKVECEFVCSDIYEIPPDYDGRYDIVVITAGVFCFMPDLDSYFDVARRLLRPGGWLTIYESHPITEMFLLDRDRKSRSPEMVYSYFETEPILHETGLDYQGGTTYDANPIYYFHYKLSDILMSCLRAGLTIKNFVEHDQDPSLALKSLETIEVKPPLSFILTAQLET